MSTMVSSHINNPAASRLAVLAGIAILVVVAYSHSYASMWALWQTSDHRHGLLVFPIAAFLVWRLRWEIAEQTIAADIRALPVLAIAAVAWALARLAGIQVLEHLLVLAMIPASVFALMGPSVFRTLLFPLAFLMLAVPVGDALVPYLMVITADISMLLFDLTGISVVREGQYFSLHGGDFVVADVCSGNRYLITGVMVSLLFGYLAYTSVQKRLILLFVTAAALILTNGIRAFIVMAVASATDMQVLGGRDHIYFGWLLFGIVMILILWIGARYEDMPEGASEEQKKAVVAEASHAALPIIAALGLVMLAVTVKPLQADFGELGAMLAAAAALLVFIFVLARQHGLALPHDDTQTLRRRGRLRIASLAAGLAGIAVLVAVPRFVIAIEASEPSSLDAEAFRPMPDCESLGPWRSPWRPRFENPAVEWSTAFDCEGQVINVYIAAYASALQGAELVTSMHYVVPPSWDRFIEAREQVSAGRFDVAEIILSRSRYDSIVWQWYAVGDVSTTSALKTKVQQILALLRREPAGGGVYVLEAPISANAETARLHLQRVSAALMKKNSFGPVGDAQ